LGILANKKNWTIKKSVQLCLIIIVTIISIFGLGLSILSFVFWIAFGFKIEFLVTSIVIFFLTLIPGYILTKHSDVVNEFQEKIQYEPPEKTTTKFKVIRYLFYIITIYLLNNFFSNFIGPFPQDIDGSLALDILKIIISTNGVLIGFSGLIFFRILPNKLLNKRGHILLITLLFLSSILKGITNMSWIDKSSNVITNDVLLAPIQFMMFGIYAFIVTLLSYRSTNENFSY